ncbi:hypothetical protein M8C21_025915 [Ambrosia artemisiifolia]|uniref:Transcription termination factor MTERF2, chloroplastic n=1 Tax=Ambrosia artemisiifolia TaxID=4212 RepID=A0AAD5CN97_AMBAR|nr:hypothetical protein M8C21_025915 [Ambrosia artemisiifolia]
MSLGIIAAADTPLQLSFRFQPSKYYYSPLLPCHRRVSSSFQLHLHPLLLSPPPPCYYNYYHYYYYYYYCFNTNNNTRHTSPSRHLSFSSSSSSSSSSGEEEDEHKQQQAIEAVSDILQENGLSQEDSMQIALNSPNYVQMLMDSVDDLDALFHQSSSSSISSSSSSSRSYKNKVIEMGKQKGDNGLVPVLESLVGLPLPSAIHIARYLSHHTPPPSLLHKVKYVKHILFSDVDGKLPISATALRMMSHLSISIDDDLQHTLSFLEKIQARRGGLHLLSSGDASFRYLIESFPKLLLLSVDSNMKPVLDFLLSVGVPNPCIRNVLLLYPPLLFYDVIKDIHPTRQLFKKVYREDKEFGKMLLKYPWILSTSIQKNYEEILGFFYANKVAEVNICHAIRSWPLLLGCSVARLKLMIDQLHVIGVTENMLNKVVATSPQLLMQKPQDFFQVVSYLKGLGLEEENIGRVLGRCPEIFMANIDKTLKKKVEFLSELGVSKKHLPRVIRKYPEFFVCDVNNSLQPRMAYLLKIGLSKREIAFMVGRFSPLLGYSIEEVLRPKYEFLANTMQKPLEEVVEYPRYFSYSLEKKIKPRFWVIKGRNCECSLKDMLGKNDEEFAADYMSV